MTGNSSLVPLQPTVISAASPELFATSLEALERLLAGETSILPLPADWQQTCPDLPEQMRAGSSLEKDLVAPGTLIACTSGSTGTPKGAVLGSQQLATSADATASFIERHYQAQPGAWLLTLPAHHIAGLQVMLRSLRAGYTPLAAAHLQAQRPHAGARFTAAGFIADTEALAETYPDVDLYTSLVPAQLERIAEDPAAVKALKRYACVLVGGAAAREGVIKKMAEEGAQIALTYGSSETAGGMVYNGQPLPGAQVRIDGADERGAGRVRISGPMVADGYRNVDSAEAFPVAGEFVTSDIGVVDGGEESGGTLRILGRADGAINTGGYKVLPEEVEKAICQQVPGVEAAFTAGVEDPKYAEFGESIGALVVLREAGNGAAEHPREVTDLVREAMRGQAGPSLIPRRAWAIREMPTTGPGKTDRQQAAAMLDELYGQPHS
ncbi:O-succinylbenzoic acid--CoA ligase [Corynebacterium sp. HMSC08A12]|uniref:AMP-binding protein n=1 Tax=Corynebacterium sp. HMSC08A12 TaxID=1581134 RepID=UPI0008A405E1|nr:AMP-binding protein [Corynebacterium sp. HMSC08A12]OFT34516.1 O-succinylbenzoic acid--CoA ligase [Corynebacterium sp. HMSC08A12]